MNATSSGPTPSGHPSARAGDSAQEPDKSDPSAGAAPILLHSGDVEEATSRVGQVFHPHRLTRIDAIRGFEADLRAVSAGPMVSGHIHYNSNSDLFCPAVTGYHLNIPLSGQLLSESAGERTLVPASNAVVYATGVDARLSTPPGSRLNIFALKFDRAAVHGALEDLLGHPVDGPVSMHGEVDLTCVDGASWRRLVLAAHDGQMAGSLLAAKLVAEPLTHAIITGLLALTRHQYSEELHSPAPDATPAAIRRAADLIHLGPDLVLTPATIAAEVGLSVRALQRGFREHLATTPMGYARRVRLQRAHADLLAARSDRDTVAAIAGRWGFHHLGRFSAEYRERFGVAPSQTLRSG